ncbi:MAG: endolytic transglycosylase MltG [Clostridia bacterium]|nr:endolytic transglycosylase MltG [Clostridia bacterium]
MSDDRSTPESRADELFKILDEFRDDAAGANPGEGEAEAPAEAEGAPVPPAVEEEKSFTGRSDEILEIISGRKSPDEADDAFAKAPDEAAEEAAEETAEAPADNGGGAEELAEMPAALFGHLTDEGSEAPQGEEPEQKDPHFTDSFTPVELPEEAEPEGRFGAEDPEEDGDGEEEARPKGGFGRALQRLSLIPKAVIYIVVVALISAYLSYYAISIGNDVFALVCEDAVVEIKIPENATDADVAEILKENGIIEYAWVYKLYMRYRGGGDEEGKYIPGTHRLNRNYNYSQIITALTVAHTKRDVVRIAIPEGFTVDQIIDLLVKNGLGTRENYVEAVNNYPYKHEFVQQLTEMGYPETRKYRLEGYLFPDTYEFYTSTSEVYVINAFLNNFNEKFWKDYNKIDGDGGSYRKMMEDEYGMSFDDIITLASMIQAEGKTAEDFEAISYVFHNRLKHSGTFPRLESDATIQYVLEKREQDAANIDISLDTPYNTYLYDGLPPGAICNPGIETIMSAMFPSAPLNAYGYEIDAYFFVANNAGKVYYATSAAGHANNKAQAARDNEAIEAGNYEG